MREGLEYSLDPGVASPRLGDRGGRGASAACLPRCCLLAWLPAQERGGPAGGTPMRQGHGRGDET